MVDRTNDASSSKAAVRNEPTPRRRQPVPSWHLTLGRLLGRATRATMGELDLATRSVMLAVDSMRPRERRPDARSSRGKRSTSG